jgi:hypothetical protein
MSKENDGRKGRFRDVDLSRLKAGYDTRRLLNLPKDEAGVKL